MAVVQDYRPKLHIITTVNTNNTYSKPFTLLWAEVCGKGEAYTGFWWVIAKEGENQEGVDVKGGIILKQIVRTGWNDVDWIRLAQDKDRWRADVNTVMNTWLPQNATNFIAR